MLDPRYPVCGDAISPNDVGGTSAIEGKTYHARCERVAKLETAARAVVWFDYSDDDEDVQAAVEALRKLVM